MSSTLVSSKREAGSWTPHFASMLRIWATSEAYVTALSAAVLLFVVSPPDWGTSPAHQTNGLDFRLATSGIHPVQCRHACAGHDKRLPHLLPDLLAHALEFMTFDVCERVQSACWGQSPHHLKARVALQRRRQAVQHQRALARVAVGAPNSICV